MSFCIRAFSAFSPCILQSKSVGTFRKILVFLNFKKSMNKFVVFMNVPVISIVMCDVSSLSSQPVNVLEYLLEHNVVSFVNVREYLLEYKCASCLIVTMFFL